MTPTLEERRDRVAELEGMDRRLQACLADVRAAHDREHAALLQASQEDMGLRRLGAVPGPPNGNVQKHIALEVVRDAVVRLGKSGSFAIGELAAALGCSSQRARLELKRVEHLVQPNGHLGQRQLYAYVPPAGPGAAFEAQQKLRSFDDDQEVARHSGGDIKQSLLSMVSDKEIKRAVREALADGWELVNAGGKHPLALVKGKRKIGFSSSPTNSEHAANAIRRDLKAAA